MFIGDWYRLDEYIVVDSMKVNEWGIIESIQRPPVYYPGGRSFTSNDSVRSFGGFWKNQDGYREYLGEYRIYRIVKDSIIYYNPNESTPVKRQRFEFASPDTLLLFDTETFNTYIKFETTIKKFYHLDSIKILEANGWGLKREYFISSSGKIRYYNYNPLYSDAVISRVGNVSNAIFESIEQRYNWANFMEINYYSGGIDGTYLETTFYSNGEIIKTISDYESSAPMRFIWANLLLINNVESKLKYPTD